MKIGSIDLGTRPVVLAPMEDVTDASFRILCREAGAAMVTTEFVSSDGLVRDAAKAPDLFERSAVVYVAMTEEDVLGKAAYIRNFDSDVQFLGYIENIKSLSDFDSDVEVEAEDHVVSLSTCTYEVDDGRYVIVGKLVELT